MNSLKQTLVALIAVFGIGFSILPQASAEVVRNGWLSGNDPECVHRGGCKEKVHAVNLVAGQTYVIDLTSNDFDAFLFLENAGGTMINWDDDGGSGLNARLVFTPTQSGDFNIVVTSYRQGETGSYSLRVSP